MKLPSIIPLPRHQQYKIVPRFYDPIREDIQNRVSRIKQNMAEEADAERRGIFQYQTGIKGTFSRRRETENLSEVLLRLALFVLMFGFLFGYIFYGPMIIYFGGLFVPAYFIYRFRDFFNRK